MRRKACNIIWCIQSCPLSTFLVIPRWRCLLQCCFVFRAEIDVGFALSSVLFSVAFWLCEGNSWLYIVHCVKNTDIPLVLSMMYFSLTPQLSLCGETVAMHESSFLTVVLHNQGPFFRLYISVDAAFVAIVAEPPLPAVYSCQPHWSADWMPFTGRSVTSIYSGW